MAHWLMSGAVHYQLIENADNLPRELRGAFPYDGVLPHQPLKRGDWLYLSGGAREIYCTGTVSRIEVYRDQTGRDLLRVIVNRQMIPNHKWVTAEEVTALPELARVYDELGDHLIPLRPRQINALNRLVERHGGTPAPDVEEDEESPKFILNQEVTLEEMGAVEFKEIRGSNPARSIADTAHDYAVAYSNVRTGSVYWGIRDDDRVVVGVGLTYPQRQAIREQFSVQFAQIQPAVSLLNGSVAFYPVLDETDEHVGDRWVCRIHVNRGDPKQLYSTASGRVIMKTDGGKQLLDAEHIAVEREKRRRLT
jgi:schlafen family protein